MQVKVSGVEDALYKLRAAYKSVIDKEAAVRISKTLKALVDATPVDTGDAQRGWRLVPLQNGFRLINNVPYIEELNNGHSKQAPARFVETVMLSQGKANGAIVIKTPD